MDVMTDFDLSQVGQSEDIDIDVDFGHEQQDEDLEFGDIDATKETTSEPQHLSLDARDEMMEEVEEEPFAMMDADDFGMNETPAAGNDYDIDIGDSHDSFWNQNEKNSMFADETGADGAEADYELAFDADVGQGDDGSAGNKGSSRDHDATEESHGQKADANASHEQDLVEEINFQDFAPVGQSSLEASGGPEGPEGENSEDQQPAISDAHESHTVGRNDQTFEDTTSQDNGQNVEQPAVAAGDPTQSSDEGRLFEPPATDAHTDGEDNSEHQDEKDAHVELEHITGSTTVDLPAAETEHVEWNEDHQNEIGQAPSFHFDHEAEQHSDIEGDSHVDGVRHEDSSTGERDEGEGPVAGSTQQDEPQGSSTSTPTTGVHHQVLVNYGDTEYRLFAKSDDDDPNQYFLSDTAVLHSPLRDFMAGLRDVISEELSPLDELLIHIDGLGLEFAESMNNDFLQNNSFGDILTVWDMLVQNDELKELQQLYIFLIVRPSCIQRLTALISQANSGRGFGEVAVYRQAVPRQALAVPTEAAYTDKDGSLNNENDEQASFDNENDERASFDHENDEQASFDNENDEEVSFDNENDEEQRDEDAAEGSADEANAQLDSGGSNHGDTTAVSVNPDDGSIPIDTDFSSGLQRHDLEGEYDQDQLDDELFLATNDADADADIDIEQTVQPITDDSFAMNAPGDGDDDDDDDVYEQTLGDGGQFASFANDASIPSSATATERGDDKDQASFGETGVDEDPIEQVQIQSVSNESAKTEAETQASADSLQVPEDEITWESDNEDDQDELTTAAESTAQVSPSSRKRDRADTGEESDAKRHRS